MYCVLSCLSGTITHCGLVQCGKPSAVTCYIYWFYTYGVYAISLTLATCNGSATQEVTGDSSGTTLPLVWKQNLVRAVLLRRFSSGSTLQIAGKDTCYVTVSQIKETSVCEVVKS